MLGTYSPEKKKEILYRDTLKEYWSMQQNEWIILLFSIGNNYVPEASYWTAPAAPEHSWTFVDIAYQHIITAELFPIYY